MLFKMAPLHFLNLPRDILFHIFKNYVPFKDKLYILSQIPEFQPFLLDRAAYQTPPVPFSPQYINLLSRLRSGWYFYRENWLHRLYLRIDETSWHISCFNFLLKCDVTRPDVPYKSCGFYSGSIDHAMKTMDKYFKKFCYMEDEALLTYYMEHEGFLIIFPTRSKILFFDKKEYTIEKNRPLFLSKFEILWNFEDKLVVTRHAPSSRGESDQKLSPILFQYREEYERIRGQKNQELSPILFQYPEDCKRWTQQGGTFSLPSWRDEYRLKNEENVEGVRYFESKI